MERTYIGSIKSHLNETVQLKGWVETIRQLKKMWFIILRDHTGLVQITYQQGSLPELDQYLPTITPESAIEMTGKVIENTYVKLYGIEVIPESLHIVSLAEPSLPIDKNSLPELRLDWRYLDLRRPENTLIFRAQTVAEEAMRAYWHTHGFMEIHSPKLMGTASESGAELFRLEYFDGYAYLAQSPQFYKQMAMAAGFDRIFEIGPVFRANPSFTSRHETEFISVDVEISWIQSHEEIMAFLENWLLYTLSVVQKTLGSDIQRLLGVTLELPALPFPRITMKEAHEILKQKGHPLPDEEDLDAEGEKLLHAHIKETLHHDFVFVTDYPVRVRPFYHMRYHDQPALTKSFDLLWQGIEIATGAQREHRYETLKQQAIHKGLTVESVQDYLNFFRYGCPPHGGFGFGLSRMMMVMLGLKNVREAVYLSRNPKRLTP